MSLRGDPSKGIEKERGGARAPLVGRAFFVLQTGSIFSQKAGEHRGNRLCLRRLSAAVAEASEGNGLLFGGPGSCRLRYVAPWLNRVSFFLIEPTDPIVV